MAVTTAGMMERPAGVDRLQAGPSRHALLKLAHSICTFDLSSVGDIAPREGISKSEKKRLEEVYLC